MGGLWPYTAECVSATHDPGRDPGMHVHLFLVVHITNYVAVNLQDLLCQNPDSKNLKLKIVNLKRDKELI